MTPTPGGDAAGARAAKPAAPPRVPWRALALAALGLLLVPAAPLAGEAEPATCEPAAVLDAYGLGSPGDELARMAAVAGSAPLRPDLVRRPADRSTTLCAGGPALPMGWRTTAAPAGGLALVPGTLTLFGNTSYPHDFNDGALWQGKGVATQLAGGVAFRTGVFSAAIAPSIAWQQNAAFRTVPTGRTGPLEYMDPWYGNGLDMPQRFGHDPFWTLSPGQSYLRLDHAGFALGVSTENMWWGPAVRNSILMSNTAAGFPHAFAGTGRPVEIGIGRLEAQAYMGRLDRSKYFPDRSHPYFYALVVDYEPRWVPGLFLGAAYVNLRSCACLSGGVDPNGLVSAFGRWVFPEAGFEVYGEWAREDWAANFADLMREPDHAQAFTIGLQRVWVASGRWVRVRAEATDLAPLRPPRDWRPGPVMYYIHGGNLSYTNGGQLIGAAIGPGGSSQYLGVDVLTPSGWYGGYLERIRRHEDVYLYSLGGPPALNDVELTAGVRHVRSFETLDLAVELAFSYRYSRDFVAGIQTNARLAVELAFWGPSRGAPGVPVRDSHSSSK